VWEIIEAAGWPVWLLIITSVYGLAIILERAWSLRSSSIAPKNLSKEVFAMIQQGTIKKQSLEEISQSSPLGEILSTAIKNQGSSLDVIKDAIDEAGENVAFKLEKNINSLGTISTVAPLLGLFGTIVGMVELFSSFTSSGHDVAVFARGISVALYNTAGGIVVAVPAMIAYRYYRSKVDHLLNDMEQQALKLVEILRGERK
jgi:biopolymer transport protein ExbB